MVCGAWTLLESACCKQPQGPQGGSLYLWELPVCGMTRAPSKLHLKLTVMMRGCQVLVGMVDAEVFAVARECMACHPRTGLG